MCFCGRVCGLPIQGAVTACRAAPTAQFRGLDRYPSTPTHTPWPCSSKPVREQNSNTLIMCNSQCAQSRSTIISDTNPPDDCKNTTVRKQFLGGGGGGIKMLVNDLKLLSLFCNFFTELDFCIKHHIKTYFPLNRLRIENVIKIRDNYFFCVFLFYVYIYIYIFYIFIFINI